MEIHMTDEQAELVKFILENAVEWPQWTNAEAGDLYEVIDALGDGE